MVGSGAMVAARVYVAGTHLLGIARALPLQRRRGMVRWLDN